jgi:hypothetical protein
VERRPQLRSSLSRLDLEQICYGLFITHSIGHKEEKEKRRLLEELMVSNLATDTVKLLDRKSCI